MSKKLPGWQQLPTMVGMELLVVGRRLGPMNDVRLCATARLDEESLTVAEMGLPPTVASTLGERLKQVKSFEDSYEDTFDCEVGDKSDTRPWRIVWCIHRYSELYPLIRLPEELEPVIEMKSVEKFEPQQPPVRRTKK